MTKLLEKAFEVASKLPPTEQDPVPPPMLDEIASEQRWDEAFAKSQDVLSSLAKEALPITIRWCRSSVEKHDGPRMTEIMDSALSTSH